MFHVQKSNGTNWQGCSHALTGYDPAVGISLNVARGVISSWMSRKHEDHWKSIHGQRQAKGFLERPSAKRAGEFLNLSRNQLRIMAGFLKDTVSNRTSN
jgi:hypothetical protein